MQKYMPELLLPWRVKINVLQIMPPFRGAIFIKGGRYLYRKNVFLFLGIIIICFSLFCGTAKAGRRHTMETKNFKIYFEEDYEKIAQKTAQIAEEVHNELKDFMQYEPSYKTHIIINDNQDLANGWADPTYFNRINIFLTPPHVYSGMVGYYESWLRLLITHEYTHILHLNINHSSGYSYGKLFGKLPLISTPNQLQPWWLIEGYATYAESQFTDGGRGSNDIYDMYLRTQSKGESFYGLRQIEGKYELPHWPPGESAIYIYGVKFCEYLAEEYGEDKLVELSYKFVENPQKGIYRAFKKIYDKDLDDVYSEWENEFNDKVMQLEKNITEDKTGEKLTDHGGYTINANSNKDGNKIAYFHYGREFPSLKIYNTKKNRSRQLVKGKSFAGGRPAWSPDGKSLIYARLNFVDAEHYYYDLYHYNFDNEKEKRITEGERAYSPVWLNNKKVLYLSRNKAGNSLKRLNLKTGESSTLYEGNEDIYLSHPSLSPDGEKLLLSIWYKGKRDICIYNLAENRLYTLLSDGNMNIFPVWGFKGKYVIYSSDKNERFNLFAYDIETNNIYQITDVFTGALAPTISEDKIYYTGYDIKGYDLYQIENDPDEWTLIGQKNDYFKEKDKFSYVDSGYNKEKEDINYEIKKYNPITTMKPRFWIPSLTYTAKEDESYLSTSVITGGIDALNRHNYQFELNYDNITPNLDYNLQYYYDRDDFPYFDLDLDVAGEDRYTGEGWLRRENAEVLITYPVIKNDFYNCDIKGGINYERFKSKDKGKLTENKFYRLGLMGSNLTGRDKIFNESIFKIDSSWLVDDFHKREITMEFKNLMSLSDKDQIAGRVFLTSNQIDGYEINDLSLIRNSIVYGLRSNEFGIINFEYRRVLKNIASGHKNIPVFYEDLNGRLFYDGGLFDFEDNSEIQVVGSEIGLEMKQFYGLSSMELTFGISSEMDKGGSELYLKFGKQF